MRSKLKRVLPIAVLAAVALSLTACNHTATRTDAEITTEVQGKFYSDQALPNKSIQVKAANGVVTLSGMVSSDAERTTAAADAASVTGVRTVVNNLDVIPPPPQSAANEPQAAAAPSEASTPETTTEPAPEPQAPERSTRSRRDRHPKPSAAARHESRQRQARQDYAQANPPEQQPYAQEPNAGQQAYEQPAAQQGYAQQPPAQQAYAPPQPAVAPAPAAPQVPTRVMVPNGTNLSIRLLDLLDSESAQVGDTFRASLSHPVELDGNIVIPADADVAGRVVDVQSAGKFKGAALLTLELTKLSYNGRSYRIRTNEWSKQIQGRGKNTAEKVGGGAVLGAIIGGLAGGGKGAAIGTLAGAGAGGTAQAVTHAKQITLEPETRLSFQLQQPISVHPASVNQRNAGRPRLE